MKKEIFKCSLCGEIIKEYPACFITSNIDGTNKKHFHDKCFKQSQDEIKEEWEKTGILQKILTFLTNK